MNRPSIDELRRAYRDGQLDEEEAKELYKELLRANFKPPDETVCQLLLIGVNQGVLAIGDLEEAYPDATKMGALCSATTYLDRHGSLDGFATNFYIVSDVPNSEWDAWAATLRARKGGEGADRECRTHYVDMTLITRDCDEIAPRQYKHPGALVLGDYVKAH